MLRDAHLTGLACHLGLGRTARHAARAWAGVVTAPTVGGRSGVVPGSDLLAALPDGRGGPAPVFLGGAPARQVDGTTCGAAVLVLLAALGDPRLARRLTQDPQAFGSLQRVVHRATTRGRWPARDVDGWAPGHPPWPRRFGTPPWGAARVARFGADVRYRAVPFDDAEPEQRSVVWTAAAAALDRGIPVPLYTGGDVGQGWATAVPRHVVLAVRRAADGWSVYEPGGGLIHRVPHDHLTGPAAGARSAATRRALGGWRRVSWALLPRRDGGPFRG